MITDMLRKTYGTAVIARHLLGQDRIPYLPVQQLHEMRDSRVRTIVRYAAETVPFYRDFFRTQGIDPADIRTAEDLAQLPLLDRETVREQAKRLVSESRAGRTAVPIPTSGSTGRPLTIYHDRYSLLANSAFNRRERAPAFAVLGKSSPLGHISITRRGSTANDVQEFLSGNRFAPLRRHRINLSVSDPLDSVIAAINQHRPEILVAYGSYMEMLFRTVAARAIDMHLPKVAVCTVDMITDEGIRLLNEHFGIPVHSRYNAVEAFKIGFTCEKHTGFHLHDDLTHVRIADAQGQNVPAGQDGEVVISNLLNRGMVLLNYRLGDVASLSPEPCPCGRTLRLLTALEGRIEDIIYLPDGRLVHPRPLCGILMERHEVVQFQLIQHTTDNFELKLVTVDREAYDRIVDGILSQLHTLLGRAVSIRARYCDKLEPEPGQMKLRPVVSLVKRQESPPTPSDATEHL